MFYIIKYLLIIGPPPRCKESNKQGLMSKKLHEGTMDMFMTASFNVTVTADFIKVVGHSI